MKIDFSKYTILTIGDIILDCYTFGVVDRVSPEAPVPILNVNKIDYKLGGAANVASNIAVNGAKSILMGFNGNDPYAQIIQDLCEKEGITYNYSKANKKTILKNRMIAKGQQMIRIDHEFENSYELKEIEGLKIIFDKTLEAQIVDGIIVQDYNKGTLPPNLIEHIIQTARSKNIPVVVDPKFKNIEAFETCSIFKPNKLEFDRAIDHYKIDKHLSFQKKCFILQEIMKFEKIYITLGADGIYSFELNKIFPTVTSELVDITGAGDSLIASLILMHLHGIKEEYICKNLNLIGSKVIQKIGTVSIDFGDFIIS